MKEPLIRKNWLDFQIHQDLFRYFDQGSWQQTNYSINDDQTPLFWLRIIPETDQIFGMIQAAIEQDLERSIDPLEMRMNCQTHGQPGWWHQDSASPDPDLQTMIYFPQLEYAPHWGGHLLVDTGDDQVHSLLPQPNMAVYIQSSWSHMALDPSRYCMKSRLSLAVKFKLGGERTSQDCLATLLETSFAFHI